MRLGFVALSLVRLASVAVARGMRVSPLGTPVDLAGNDAHRCQKRPFSSRRRRDQL